MSRDDYAGSASCAACHADIHDKWQRSPMHRMTRLLPGAEVHAPFDGAVFRFKDDHVSLETHGGERYMHLVAVEKGGVSKWFRVTKIIGGRVREDFAGVEVDKPAKDAKVLDPEEKVLPVSHMLGAHASGTAAALRYKGYSVMEVERPGLRAAGEWRKRCIFCHDTQPWLWTALGPFLPSAKPYQGVVVDAMLPPGRRATYSIVDEGAFRAVLARDLAHVDAGAAAKIPAAAAGTADAVGLAIDTLRKRVGQEHLVEVGIGCESCHGGAREHVADPKVKPSYLPRAPWLSVEVPAPHAGGTDAAAQAQSRACARCHQVLFSGYAWTWEGGARANDPGGSNINSGEARDFLLGGCASQMSCSTCHDPHAPDDAERVRALAGPKGDALCTKCHAKYQPEPAHRAHAHHDPKGPGGACVACHMPRKNMALDTTLGRYHRIGSPTDPNRVERDRPLECALCHADKSVRALVQTMEAWWGKAYDRAALGALYGSLDATPVLATLSRGKPHEQAVAIVVAGEAKIAGAAAAIAPHTTHPIPLLRYYAVSALEKVLGRPSPVDLHRPNAEIEAATKAWIGSAVSP